MSWLRLGIVTTAFVGCTARRRLEVTQIKRSHDGTARLAGEGRWNCVERREPAKASKYRLKECVKGKIWSTKLTNSRKRILFLLHRCHRGRRRRKRRPASSEKNPWSGKFTFNFKWCVGQHLLLFWRHFWIPQIFFYSAGTKISRWQHSEHDYF